MGIPAEHLEKVFEPYFTTKEMGDGLGLTTSYSIIKQHHGHIMVESPAGQGATFQVYLPASDRQAAEPPKPELRPRPGKGKILIMDDESIARQTLGQMLLTMGYEVELSEDGLRAIDLYAQAQDTGAPFAAVILDLIVPGGMGGKETMTRLLQINPQVKAIVSRGYSDDPVMADFQTYGFAEVIAKPYSIADLDKALKKTLSQDIGLN